MQKRRSKKKKILEDVENEDAKDNNCGITSRSNSDDSDKSVESIPDVLYQKKVKKRKDQRETAGKWKPKGMVRLNTLITMVQENRNSETRETFEEELQRIYIKHADTNMEIMARNKRKREMEEMNSRKKGVVVKNVLDLVAL